MITDVIIAPLRVNYQRLIVNHERKLAEIGHGLKMSLSKSIETLKFFHINGNSLFFFLLNFWKGE